jgi:hypothetical protein
MRKFDEGKLYLNDSKIFARATHDPGLVSATVHQMSAERPKLYVNYCCRRLLHCALMCIERLSAEL